MQIPAVNINSLSKNKKDLSLKGRTGAKPSSGLCLKGFSKTERLARMEGTIFFHRQLMRQMGVPIKTINSFAHVMHQRMIYKINSRPF